MRNGEVLTAPHISAGYQEIRYFVNIDSNASEEIITKMIEINMIKQH
jgi:hypothetical protein